MDYKLVTNTSEVEVFTAPKLKAKLAGKILPDVGAAATGRRVSLLSSPALSNGTRRQHNASTSDGLIDNMDSLNRLASLASTQATASAPAAMVDTQHDRRRPRPWSTVELVYWKVPVMNDIELVTEAMYPISKNSQQENSDQGNQRVAGIHLFK